MNRLRTSVRLLITSGLGLGACLLSMWGAEAYHEALNLVDFGLDMGRPWNLLDILWSALALISAGLFAASMLFLSRND